MPSYNQIDAALNFSFNGIYDIIANNWDAYVEAFTIVAAQVGLAVLAAKHAEDLHLDDFWKIIRHASYFLAPNSSY